MKVKGAVNNISATRSVSLLHLNEHTVDATWSSHPGTNPCSFKLSDLSAEVHCGLGFWVPGLFVWFFFLTQGSVLGLILTSPT